MALSLLSLVALVHFPVTAPTGVVETAAELGFSPRILSAAGVTEQLTASVLDALEIEAELRQLLAANAAEMGIALRAVTDYRQQLEGDPLNQTTLGLHATASASLDSLRAARASLLADLGDVVEVEVSADAARMATMSSHISKVAMPAEWKRSDWAVSNIGAIRTAMAERNLADLRDCTPGPGCSAVISQLAADQQLVAATASMALELPAIQALFEAAALPQVN